MLSSPLRGHQARFGGRIDGSPRSGLRNGSRLGPGVRGRWHLAACSWLGRSLGRRHFAARSRLGRLSRASGRFLGRNWLAGRRSWLARGRIAIGSVRHRR